MIYGFTISVRIFDNSTNRCEYELIGCSPVTDEKIWAQILPRESCFNTPGYKFNRSEEVTCTIFWPEARASSSIAIHNGNLYLFGGFTSFFPYPFRDGVGAESGTNTRSTSGTSPYGVEINYLSDFWKYDFGKDINTRTGENLAIFHKFFGLYRGS